MPRTGERGGPLTRARIAEVAGRMFLERGFDAVTVAEVARASGVSTVTVYNHFPRKEDLFLARAQDAEGLLRDAVRDRAAGVDVLTALHDLVLRLIEERHPLGGVDDRSLPLFRTVAASPALIGRAREIEGDLAAALREELADEPLPEADADLLTAFVVAGYGAVLARTTGRRIAGEPSAAVLAEHRAAVEQLFTAVRRGVGLDETGPAQA